MTEKEALQILYDRVMQNVFWMSGNYLMSRPRAGVPRQQWETERELADIVQNLLNEME